MEKEVDVVPNHNGKSLHLGNREIRTYPQLNQLVELAPSKEDTITLKMRALNWGRHGF